MIGAGIFAQLVGNAAVGAIIGERVFTEAAPPDQAQLPCLVVTMVGGAVSHGLNTILIRQRVQIDALALNSDECDSLRDAVVAAMLRWNGLLTNGARVLDTLLLNPGTEFADEERIFRQMVEFYVLYTQPLS